MFKKLKARRANAAGWHNSALSFSRLSDGESKTSCFLFGHFLCSIEGLICLHDHLTTAAGPDSVLKAPETAPALKEKNRCQTGGSRAE